jgi:predicted dehydrogenase
MRKNKNTNRRTFLKDISMVTGALTLGPLMASTSCAADNQNKLGVALVGLGNYSTTMLGPALKETENCYLAGIVTGTPAKAEKWAEEYNIPEKNIYNYDNFDQIADNPDIDIVYVVLPNSLHAEYSIRALEAGKHVICEKPMALNAEEARKMIEAAKKANRKLSVGYRMHYDPYFIDVKKLAQNETYGPVNYLEAALGYSFTPQAGSWKLKKAMGGGSMYNLGVYPIQSVRYAKGSEPIYVTAQASTKRKDIFTEVSEAFTWQLEWEDGTLAQCFCGPNAYLDRLYVGCTEGRIMMEPATNYTGQAVTTPEGKLDYPQVFQQKLQIDDFARCVRDNEASMVDAVDGLRDALIIDAIHEGIRTGEKVEIGRV